MTSFWGSCSRFVVAIDRDPAAATFLRSETSANDRPDARGAHDALGVRLPTLRERRPNAVELAPLSAMAAWKGSNPPPWVPPMLTASAARVSLRSGRFEKGPLFRSRPEGIGERGKESMPGCHGSKVLAEVSPNCTALPDGLETL